MEIGIERAVAVNPVVDASNFHGDKICKFWRAPGYKDWIAASRKIAVFPGAPHGIYAGAGLVGQAIHSYATRALMQT